MVAASDKPNWLKNCPIRPGRKAIGRNTASSDSVADSTAVETSPAPLKTASICDTPLRRQRAMFSAMTIESSTTRPTATVTASSVTVLKVKPSRPKITTAPVSVMGMASTTPPVDPRRPTNSSTTSATARTARPVSRTVSTTDVSTKTEVSETTVAR